MRVPSLLAFSILTTLSLAHARVVPPFQALPVLDSDQSPVMGAPSTGGQTVSDVLPRSQEIAIFTSFTRDISSISSRFESTVQNVTVLAPEDAEIKKLPRKPWENPEDYSAFGESAYEGQGGIDRAQENLKRFVEAHVVGVSPWKEGEKVKTLVGSEVWYEKRDGTNFIQPGNIEVVQVADKVSNGEVWVIKGVLNYAE
jgi:hypothetical protein